MTELTLVRHGQANSAATDEASYDRLSELGHQQARLLGAHLQETGGFTRVISGKMRRQIDTATGLNVDSRPHSIDPRLNELDYYGLSDSLNSSNGLPYPDSAEGIIAHIPNCLLYTSPSPRDS